MLRYWFIPSRAGDFRIEPISKGKTSCRLTVVDPTDWERQNILDPFLADAREQGWVAEGVGYQEEGESRIKVQAPIVKAGSVLAALTLQAKGDTWTALRYESGKVTLLPEGHDPGKAIEKGSKGRDKPKAAATIAKPQRGCPPPEPCNVRAAQVLRTFSTTSQWEDFQRTRSMQLTGNHTGQTYRVYHRDTAAARHLGHLLIDHRGDEVCVWDNRVPPEEEMLAVKLAVEHRERWMLGLGKVRPRMGGSIPHWA